MQQILLKLAVGLAMQLLSEKFLARFIIHSLRSISAKTSFTVDDEIVDDIAEALGQPDLKRKNP